jgi:hypothetical protein
MVMLAIYRKTMGWKKWRDNKQYLEMSVSYLSKATQLNHVTVRNALKSLIADDWVKVSDTRGHRGVKMYMPTIIETSIENIEDGMPEGYDPYKPFSSTSIKNIVDPLYKIETKKEKKETTPKKKEKEKESTPNTEPTNNDKILFPFSGQEANSVNGQHANGKDANSPKGKPDTTAGAAAADDEHTVAYTPEHMAAMKKKADEIVTAMAKCMEIE